MKIKNIALVGGTHGNEYTGVYLIRKLRLEQFHQKWEGLNIKYLIGNPKAYEKNVRFVDHDLNRSFGKKDLSNLDLSGYEYDRAKAINQIIGPKGSPNTDLIIDMHTTTTNMGVTIILANDNCYNFEMASYVKSKTPNCYIYYISAEAYTGAADHPFLNSLAPYGFALEVGPIPNGIVRHDVLHQTNMAINAALEFVSISNSGGSTAVDNEIEVFKHKKTVDFPNDPDGNINAIIHQNFQDKDYQPLKKGDPIFTTLGGDVILFEEDKVFYPVFINEAAYYYKNTAFSLTEKVTVNCWHDLTNA